MKEYIYKTKLYFILAFAITWVFGGILIYQSYTTGEKSILALLIAYMGPFIAYLVIMFMDKNKEYRKDFRSRLTSLKRAKGRYWLFALLFLPVMILLSITISLVFGQSAEQYQIAEELQVFSGELVLSMIILALVPFLEELGWRGYGVDALTKNNTVLKSALIFGLLWALWHLPVFFIKGSYQAGLWEMNPIYALNFFVGIIPLAVIMNWLYYRSNRSMLVLIVFHILVNLSSELFSATQISKCILTLVLFVVAGILYYLDKERLFNKKLDELDL